MPLANIVDNRKGKYRWRIVNAVIEATWHDNSCKDSDISLQPPSNCDGPDCDNKNGLSLSEAITWANSYVNDVTLFLYDEDVDPFGNGTTIYPNKKEKH